MPPPSSPTTRPTSPPLTPAHLLLQIPHIVEAILSPADRRTLLASLRVAPLHDAAGKFVYHIVRVHRSNLANFFLGALVGVRSEESGCDGEGCKRFTHETVMYLSRGKLRRQLEQEEEEAKEVDSGGGKTNFKRHLLAHVRVLSLSSHHVCACRLYAPHLATLVPNLDTIRIVPAPASDQNLERICDARECALFRATTARRLVLRNIDGNAGALSGWPLSWRDEVESPFTEVVWVLPTSPAQYQGDGLGLKWAARLFGRTRRSYAFAEWEVWGSPSVPGRRHWSAPVSPTDVVHVITGAGIEWLPPPSRVVGLERVGFRDDGDSIGSVFGYSHARRGSDSLRQMVRDKLDRRAVDGDHNDAPVNDCDNERAVVVFRTLEEYALDAESRGVLDDGMRADLPEPLKPTPTPPTPMPPTPTLPTPTPPTSTAPSPTPPSGREAPYVLHPNCRDPLKTAISVFCTIM